MAQTTYTSARDIADLNPAAAGSSSKKGSRVVAGLKGLFRRSETWSGSDASLLLLNDHLLQDIGVSRADLEAFKL